MAAGKGILGIASGGLDQIVKPVIYLIIIVGILYLIKKGIEAWKIRNVGTSGGAKDGSNIATDIYNLDGWFVDPNQIDEVCGRVLLLDDDDLKQVYNKFQKLYGDKCKGGGVFCDDTTSMKIFLIEQSCALAGCKNRDLLVERLSSLGL